MPIHFNSITNDSPSSAFAWMMQEPLQKADEAVVSEDKKHIHCASTFKDALTDIPIGKFIYTMEIHPDSLEILDVDIILLNDEAAEIEFVDMLDVESEPDKYYHVEAQEEGQHLYIETVNRYAVNEEIVGTTREVSVSAFPFELNVYDSIDDFNREIGFDEVKTVGDTDITVGGLSETFAGCSLDEDNYSMVVGKVVAFKDVRLSTPDKDYDFVLAWLDTALGLTPTAMGREVFDLESLGIGKIIVMNTYIKAELIVD